VVTTAIGRAAACAAAAATLAIVAAACSSGSDGTTPSGGGSSPAQSKASQREVSAGVLLTQCAITRHIGGVAASATKISGQLPAAQQWMQGSQISLTKTNASQFNAWYQGHVAGVTSHGNSIDRWAEQAATSGKLPAAICGAGTSPSSLYQQIYAKFPSQLKHDPWQG
jgi:hypothetical protein